MSATTGRRPSEKTSLLPSRGEEAPPYEERSMEETAKSMLLDPNHLTSFDECRKVSAQSQTSQMPRRPGVLSLFASPQTTVSTSFIEEVVSVKERVVSGKKWEGLTKVLLLSVLAAELGSSTQFGFNTGVINNPKDVSL